MLDTIQSVARFIKACFKFAVWWLFVHAPAVLGLSIGLQYATSGFLVAVALALVFPIFLFGTLRAATAFRQVYDDVEEDEDA